jgi:hypothetical protein
MRPLSGPDRTLPARRIGPSATACRTAGTLASLLALLVCGLAVAPAAQATKKVYRCEGGGRVTYQQTPCQNADPHEPGPAAPDAAASSALPTAPRRAANAAPALPAKR